jgi:hypothetical protein
VQWRDITGNERDHSFSSLSKTCKICPTQMWGRVTLAIIVNLVQDLLSSLLCRNLDSIVGIATGYGLNDRGIGLRVPVGSIIFSTSYRPALGLTQPPNQWIPVAVSPEVKRLGREADHSLPASAEERKIWIYISTPPHAFML